MYTMSPIKVYYYSKPVLNEFMLKPTINTVYFAYIHFKQYQDYLSHDMRFPTMWYVRPAKAQTSLRMCAV